MKKGQVEIIKPGGSTPHGVKIVRPVGRSGFGWVLSQRKWIVSRDFWEKVDFSVHFLGKSGPFCGKWTFCVFTAFWGHVQWKNFEKYN